MAMMRARRAPFTDARDGRLKSRVRQAFRLFGGKPLTTIELVKHCYCWVLQGEKIKSWHRANVSPAINSRSLYLTTGENLCVPPERVPDDQRGGDALANRIRLRAVVSEV
jgi:hypothetical protein